MQRSKICVLAAQVVTLLLAGQAAANFANPSFESPIAADGPPFVGFWEAFSSAGTGAFGNTSTLPRTGAMAVNLGLTAGNAFAGVFQDIPNPVPGFPVNFNGWHRTAGTAPINLGVEVRIEWRNSVTTTEISRTPNSTPVPTGAYGQFTLTSVVPAGADSARAVYAIQSFSTNPMGSSGGEHRRFFVLRSGAVRSGAREFGSVGDRRSGTPPALLTIWFSTNN
jgi:hypothetical protein